MTEFVLGWRLLQGISPPGHLEADRVPPEQRAKSWLLLPFLIWFLFWIGFGCKDVRSRSFVSAMSPRWWQEFTERRKPQIEKHESQQVSNCAGLFGTTCRKKIWFISTFWSPWRRHSNVLWSTSFGRPQQPLQFFASCEQPCVHVARIFKNAFLAVASQCLVKKSRFEAWLLLIFFVAQNQAGDPAGYFDWDLRFDQQEEWLATAIAECAMQVNMDGERSAGIQIEGRPILMAKVHAEDKLWAFELICGPRCKVLNVSKRHKFEA